MVTYGLLGLNLLLIVQLLVLSLSANRSLQTQFRNARIVAPILTLIAIASIRDITLARVLATLAIMVIDLLIVEIIDRMRRNWNTIKSCPHSLVDKIDARLEGR